MIHAGIARSSLLIEQGRFDLAEQELRRRLTEQQDDALAHALLAFCLMKQSRLSEAEREAREAVSLAPDEPFGHFHLGQILDERDRLDEAASAFQEAMRLDPEDPDHPAALASIRVQQRRWNEALELVERGLQLDPDHSGCTNLHAMILSQTGRTEEAHATLDDALAREPENALAHANRGWTLLRESRPQPAIEHFREALRLSPSMEYARIGIVEAMKARNPIYRPVLRFFLWLGSLEGKSQAWLILGLFFGVRLLRQLARTYPATAPVLYPLIFLYAAFVLLTWIADPLFNLLLRLDRFGRLALSREQIVASNWLAGILGLGLAALAAGLALGSQALLLVAACAGGLILPVVAIFRCRPGWPRRAMVGYCLVMAFLLALTIVNFAEASRAGRTDEAASFFAGTLAIALLGAVLSTWIGAGLSFARSRSRS
ncbi:MAG TPA: tetratricopeptide repeat protein [Thermoanaerobaculia bacterium]|nr:tetratricopeptide repeat protein [Thermoanaerobaculia bacterium]